MNTEDQLKPYYDFLNECRQKNYSESTIHRHHIIPRFMGGDGEPKNLIDLSIEDHFNAHVTLASCFDKSNDFYRFNMTSANLIVSYLNNPEHSKQLGLYLSEIFSGEGNPMYGKRGCDNPNFGKCLTGETIEKIRQTRQNQWNDLEWACNYMETRTQDEFDKISIGLTNAWKDPKKRQNYLDSFTVERRNLISIAMKEIWEDETYRNARMENILRGELHPNYNQPGRFLGRSHTEETKDLMSTSAKKSWTAARRKKASETQKQLREGKSSGKLNGNSAFYIVTESGEIFHTRNDAMEGLRINGYRLTTMIKSGEVVKKSRREMNATS